MSGGHFKYKEYEAAANLFGGMEIPRYTEDVFALSTLAGTEGPFDSRRMNELLWDVLCMVHAYDLLLCGDTDRKTWGDAKKTFENKWRFSFDDVRWGDKVEC